MKSSLSLWMLLCVSLFSCGDNPERQGRKLLERSSIAHGGADAWEEISSLKFNKRTRLLREDGEVESELDQQIEFRLKPNFEGKISWIKDSLKHVSTWDGGRMRYYMGENEVTNPGFLAAKRKEIDMEFDAVAQPWKLLNEKSTPIYEGQKTLENGKQVEVIRLDSGPDADVWYYYFDPQSAMMVGSEAHVKDQKTLSYYLGYSDVQGLKVPGQRDQWRVNDQGEKLFLRAEYLYSDYQIVK
jgi:hypothetical protein